METIITKLQSNKDLSKGIQFDAINKANFKVDESIKRTFEHSLNLSNLMYLANEYYNSKECKNELKKMNIDVPKHEFFKDIFGFEKAQTFRLIQVGKLMKDKTEIVNEFKNSNNSQTLIELLKFAKVGNEETDGNEETETDVKKDENLKISVNKDNKITIKGKAKKEVLTQLIEELKKMLTEC